MPAFSWSFALLWRRERLSFGGKGRLPKAPRQIVPAPPLVGEQHTIAEHDFDKGQPRTLVKLRTNDGAADIVWDKDGNQWVVMSANGSDDNTIDISTHDVAGKQTRLHQIQVKGRNITLLDPPDQMMRPSGASP